MRKFLNLFLFIIFFLFSNNVFAAPAAYFTDNTSDGETRFRSDVASANSNAEFFEHHITSSTSSYPIEITGSNNTKVYLKISRGGSASSQSDSVVHTHDGNSQYYMDGYSVGNHSAWSDYVNAGVKFEFFSDINMTTKVSVNAVATFSYHWGTCCLSSNMTPTGNRVDGTALYAVFGDGSSDSTNLIGNITERINADTHFVALIDDTSETFNQISFVANGNGEYFALGGYILFSKVGQDSVPEGSSYTPTIDNNASMLTQPDTLASIETMLELTSDVNKVAVNTIFNRLSNVNKNTNDSTQSLRFKSNNIFINHLMSSHYKSDPIISNSNMAINQYPSGEIVMNEYGEIGVMTLEDRPNKTNDIYNLKMFKDFLLYGERIDSDLKGNFTANINPFLSKFKNNWNFWVGGDFVFGKDDSRTGVSEKDTETNALTIGLDKRYNDKLYIGGALLLSQTDINIGSVGSSIDSENHLVSLYSTYELQNNYDLHALIGYGEMDMDSIRIDSSQTLLGNRVAEQTFASLKLVNKNISCGEWCISTFGRLDLSQTKLEPLSESGGNKAILIKKQRHNEVVFNLGADFIYTTRIKNNNLKPFIKMEYGYDLSKASRAAMSYINQSTEYTYEPDIHKNGNLTFSIGSEIFNDNGLMGKLNYQHTKKLGVGETNSVSVILDLPISEFINSFQ